MTNKELTQAIIAIVLEEVNGYSSKEATLFSKENNGVVEDRIYKLLEEQRPDFNPQNQSFKDKIEEINNLYDGNWRQ